MKTPAKFPQFIYRTLAAVAMMQVILPSGFTTLTERAWADASLVASIPDDLDVAKYDRLYQAAKAVSDPVRAEANRLLSILQADQSRSDASLTDLNSKRDALSAAQARVARLEASYPNLQAQIDSLRSESDRIRSAINGNNLIVSNLNQELQSLNQQVPSAQTDVGARRASYDQMLSDIQNADGRLSTAQSDLARAQQSLTNAQSQDDLSNRAFQDSVTESNALRIEQGNLPNRLNQLSQQIRDTDARIAQARSIVDAQSAALAPLRQRLANAQEAQRQIGQAMSQARSAADAANRAVADSNTQGRQAQDQALAAGNAIVSRHTEQNALASDIQSQQAVSSEAQSTMTGTDAEIARLTASNVQIRAQIDALTVDINAKNALIQEARRRNAPQAEVQPILVAVQQSINQKTTLSHTLSDQGRSVEQQNQTRNSAAARKQSADNKINQDNSRLAAIPAEIEAKTRELGLAQSRASQLANDRPALQAAAQAAQAHIPEVQQGADAAAAEAQNSQQALNSASSALNQAQQQLTSQTDSRNRLASDFQTSQARSAFVNGRINELAGFQSSTQSQINDLESRQIPFFRNQVAQAQEVAQVSGRRGQDLRAAAEPFRQDLSRRIDALNALQQRQAGDTARIQQLLQENSGSQADLQSKQGQIQAANDQIQSNSQSAAEARRSMASIASAIPALEAGYSAVQAVTDQARVDYTPADQAAMLVERQTLAAARRLTQVQGNYSQGMQAAHTAGTSLGARLGSAEGKALGSTDGFALGQSFGALAGSNDGTADGLRRGSASGNVNGLQAGHEVGFLPTELESAKAQGKADAMAEAKESERPKGQAAKSAELLAALPATLTEIVMPQNAGSGSQYLTLSKVADAPDGQVRDSMLVIRNFELVGDDCTRGFADFDRACQADSLATYRSSFERAYLDAQLGAYSQGYSSTYDANFSGAKSVATRSSYDLAYAQSFRAGVTQGATDGLQPDYLAARAAARAQALDEAKASQNWQGRADIRDRAQSSSLIGVDAANLVSGMNGSLKVAVQLANAGTQATLSGQIKVRVQSLSNGVAADGEFALFPPIGAQSRTRVVTPLVVQAPSSAVNSGTATLLITVYLPNGTSIVKTVTLGAP